MKNDIIVGDIFEMLFKVQTTWHKLFWKVKRMLKTFKKKTQNFICSEMLEQSEKLYIKKFGCFHLIKIIINMYKISCLHPPKYLINWLLIY